jgi:hypothetical protein
MQRGLTTTMVLIGSLWVSAAVAQPAPGPIPRRPPPEEEPVDEPPELDEPPREEPPMVLTPTPAPTWVEPTPPAQLCDALSCEQTGACPDAAGACVSNLVTCRQSHRCRALGYCTPHDNDCIIGSNDDCRHSAACDIEGLCAARGQSCVAEEPVHCLQSKMCGTHGLCRVMDGRCIQESPVVGDVTTHPRSVAMRNTGIAFSIIGPVLGLLGGGMFLSKETAVAAAFLAPIGGSLTILGVPMWALGASEIPDGTEPNSSGSIVGGVILAGLGLSGIGVGTTFFLTTEENTITAIPMAMGGSMLIAGIALGVYGIETTALLHNTSLRLSPLSFDLSYRW